MIRSFRHRGLRRLYEHDDARGLKQDQVRRVARALFLLDNAESPDQIDQVPGLRVHRLSGDLAGLWSMSVSGNGGSYSASRAAMRSMSILSIITEAR